MTKTNTPDAVLHIFNAAQTEEATAIGVRIAQAESVIGGAVKEFKTLIGAKTRPDHKARLAEFRVAFEAGYASKNASKDAAKMAWSRLLKAADYEALSNRGRKRKATDTAGKAAPKESRKPKTANLLAGPRDAVIARVRTLAVTKGITAHLAERNAATLAGLAAHWDQVAAYALRLARADAKAKAKG